MTHGQVLAIVLACLLTQITGCTSPAGDSVGSFSGNTTDGGGSGGGIGGSGVLPTVADYSIGPIAGFGSIILNGQRYATSNTTFFVNGEFTGEDALRVGMVVRAAVDFQAMTADQVDYKALVIGPVSNHDTTARSLNVYGQRIRYTAATAFDALSAAELTPGMTVEISGERNASDELIASFIRQASDPTQAQLVGIVSNSTADGRQAQLGGSLIDVSEADVSALTDQRLRDGDLVLVTGRAPADMSIPNRFTVERAIAVEAPEYNIGNALEVEGFVVGFDSVQSFTINGQRVRTSSDTRLERQDGSSAAANAVSLNARLEVEGTIGDDNVLNARRIISIPTENSELVGTIELIDPSTQSITVLGVTLQTTPSTRFRSMDRASANFDGLRVGNYVEINATFSGGRLIATQIEQGEPDSEATLQGPITALNATNGTLSVLGISISLSSESEFQLNEEQSINQAEFLRRVQVGAVVKVKWKEFSSVTLPADELELELE